VTCKQGRQHNHNKHHWHTAAQLPITCRAARPTTPSLWNLSPVPACQRYVQTPHAPNGAVSQFTATRQVTSQCAHNQASTNAMHHSHARHSAHKRKQTRAHPLTRSAAPKDNSVPTIIITSSLKNRTNCTLSLSVVAARHAP
jgi:hypothetical protein